jgi:hypothetical protein
MSPEERELLNKTVTLTEENNKMLHGILRAMRIQRIMSIIYWVFILGSAIGAYYIIQPYLSDLVNIYSSTGNILETLQ